MTLTDFCKRLICQRLLRHGALFWGWLLDYPKAAVYDGGWIEWSRKDYPVDAPSGPTGAGEGKQPRVKAAPPASRPCVPSGGR